MKTTKNLFQKAISRENDGRPPVWFMRQAGRYHSHYQNLKISHSFMDLCKVPKLALETTLGPVQDFGFDAGILFSDLLFPLEAMGMPLRYDPGPKLDWHLRTEADLMRLRGGRDLARHMGFQGEAMRLIRDALPAEKGLLGFVGGPLTLFFYAVEGSHQGTLGSAREGLRDGRFTGFNAHLLDLLAENMAIQARAGADTIAVLDTCAGEIDASTFREIVVPVLRELFARYEKLGTGVPISYYSKGTGPEHWRALADASLPIACLGIDWRHDLAAALREWGGEWAIQGNVDPDWMLGTAAELEPRLREVFASVKKLPASSRRGWVCGLGHGVVKETPESNVRLFLKIQKEIFS